jgi:DNA anti-recombination protein RmuC
MDKDLQGLITHLDKQFEEMSQQIQGLREEMTQEFANVREEMAQGFANAREENRHTRVLVEDVHSNVRLVAEGVIGMGERMDTFRTEVTTEVKNIRSLVQDAYSALERRVHTLETWRETKERDPLDIIRERYGKRQPT